MKGFFIEVSNSLLDPRHCKQMGESVWLFMWLIDKMTTITKEKGKVLGGKPIKYEDVKEDLGISRSTYFRWLETLKDGKYIDTVRTPYGNCIVVLKAKKRFNKKQNDASDVSEMNHPIRSTGNEPSRSVINGTQMTQDRTISVPEMNHLNPGNEPSNKTVAVDNTVDNSNSSYPSGPEKLGETGDESFTLLVEEDKPNNGALVNSAIDLFRPLFPGDFVGKRTAFAKKPTREAVEKLLERYSIVELNTMIQKYADGKSDPYRPGVGTVYEFCTFKLAKAEAYVSKNGGLYAQRSISTPEQEKRSDEQYLKIIEHNREKVRKAREDWKKTHGEQ